MDHWSALGRWGRIWVCGSKFKRNSHCHHLFGYSRWDSHMQYIGSLNLPFCCRMTVLEDYKLKNIRHATDIFEVFVQALVILRPFLSLQQHPRLRMLEKHLVNLLMSMSLSMTPWNSTAMPMENLWLMSSGWWMEILSVSDLFTPWLKNGNPSLLSVALIDPTQEPVLSKCPSDHRYFPVMGQERGLLGERDCKAFSI